MVYYANFHVVERVKIPTRRGAVTKGEGCGREGTKTGGTEDAAVVTVEDGGDQRTLAENGSPGGWKSTSGDEVASTSRRGTDCRAIERLGGGGRGRGGRGGGRCGSFAAYALMDLIISTLAFTITVILTLTYRTSRSSF